MKNCPSCNAPVNEDDVFCTYCGYKFPTNHEKSSKQIIIIIIAILIASICIGVGKYIYDYIACENYKYNVEDCAYTMIQGAADAEDACNTIVSVWNNSIWQVEDNKTDKYTIDPSTGEFYSDFNDSLNNLFSDDDFVDDLNDINDNYEDVNDRIKELQNPPKGCEQLHDAFMDFYDEYYELMDCALDPQGSLSTYSDDFNDADKKAAKYYEKLQVYFD